MFGTKNTLCPYCKETIKIDAVKCKHCGEWKKAESIKDEKLIFEENIPEVALSKKVIAERGVYKNDNVVIENDNTKLLNDITKKDPAKAKKSKLKIFIKPFSFKGRISRAEYCWSYAIIIFSIKMFIVLMSSISEGAEFIQVICILLFWFLLYWFLLAQSTKRCHDVGYNGWFQLIPLFNVYLLFFANSELGINKYGVNPKGQNSSLDDAVEYYNRGFENRRLRKYNEAISDYKKSIELSPDDADTFNNLGYCYLEMQNYDDAKNSFLKCLEIDGKYIDSLIGISILYYEEQKFDESKLWMQKAIDLKPILREGMEGLKKLEEDGWIYKEENKAVIKKVFNLFLQTLSIKSN